MSEDTKIPLEKEHDFSMVRQETQKSKKLLAEEELQDMTLQEMRQLIQELQTQQVELKSQNQQLLMASQELEAATVKYQDLYHHSPFGYVTLDAHGLVEEVNAKGEQLLATERAQLLNRKFSQFIHKDGLDAFKGFLKKISHSHAAQTVELQILSASGKLFYAQLEGILFRRANNTDQCRIAFVDISERKKASIDLFNKEALLSTIINSSLNAIQVFKAVRTNEGQIQDFEWVLLNHSAELFLDTTLPQLTTHRLSTLLPEFTSDQYFSMLVKVVELDHPATFTIKVTLQSKEFWLNCVAVKLEDGLVLTFEDVTQERIAHDKLQESQLMVKKMAEAMPDFLYVEDLQAGRNVYNNRNFLSFLGYRESDLKGHPRELLDTLYHPDDAHLLFDRASRFAEVKDGDFLEYLVRIKDKRGFWRNIQFRETIFKRGASGRPVQLVGIAQDITEKKRADRELRRLSKTVNTILESLPVIIWRIDAEGRITESIGSGLVSMGFRDHELEGQLITDVNPSIVPNIKSVLQGKSEVFMATSEVNGTTIYKQNYFIYDKETQGGIGFCLDITEQKLAEAEAKYRTLILDQLLQHLPLVLAVIDQNARYLEIRGKGLQSVGIKDDELKGKSIYEVFPSLKDNISDVLAGQIKSFTATFPFQDKEVHFQNFGFLDKVNQIGIAFGIDITELHEAKEKLIVEKEFSENLLETHINGIVAFDKEMTVTAFNKAMEQITSYPREKVLGKSAHSFLSKSKQATLKRNIEKVLKGAQVTIRHLPFLPQDRSFEANLAPLYGPNKEVVGVLGILWDVTDQKAKQKADTQFELSQQKAVMEAVLHTQNEERKRIAEALHNSLAQLLYAAKLNLEELQTEVKAGVDITEPITRVSGFLEDAIKETRTLAHELIPRVLEDLGLKSALKDLATRLTSKTLSIQCVVTGFDQPTDYALETHIFRFVQELLNNIMKHAQASEALVQVVDNGNLVRIRVEDNGKGLRIQELDNPTSKGMGLKTLKSRVKLLQGDFTISPPDAEGTTITIEIPTK